MTSRARYRWIVAPRLTDERTLALDVAAGAPTRAHKRPGAPLSLRDALAFVGLPQAIDAKDKAPEQELIELLQRAAEIEHSLLLQYLFARYSAVESRIARTIRSIAIEEMGHLITVQNLLVACRQPAYLSRDDASEFQPFPFRLEALSRATLAKFAAAEMPAVDSPNFPDEYRADIPAIVAEARAAAQSDVAAHRVGLLYTYIYWLMRPDDGPMANEPWTGFPVAQIAANKSFAGRHVGESFFTNQTAREAARGQWSGTGSGGGGKIIVDSIVDRMSALSAVAEISAQGEGFGATPDGHFERFAASWRTACGATAPIARPTVVDPWRAGAQSPAKPADSEITEPVALKFAEIGDAAYETCLLLVAYSFALPAAASRDVRLAVASAALACMTDGMAACATTLLDLPLVKGGDDGVPRCGLPFSAFAPIDASDIAGLKARLQAAIGRVIVTAGAVDAALGATDAQVTAAASVADSFQTNVLPAVEAAPVG